MSDGLVSHQPADLQSSAEHGFAASGKALRWTGWAMSGLAIAFMVFDGVTKIAMEQHVVASTTQIGHPVELIQPLGIICLVCTVLYAVPRTAILGAILLTGFLGGAVASKLRIEETL